MPYALETRKEESPAPDGFVLSDLWMIPLLLLVQIFARFRQHLTDLKAMRRARPMPQDWRSFYPSLRTTEWAIRQLCHEGARRILLGEDLDLTTLSYDAEPPDSFQPAMPRSAMAMHQRIADTARFHADPERYIRRHAERVRTATATGPARPAEAPHHGLASPSPFLSSPFFVFFIDRRIRAPP